MAEEWDIIDPQRARFRHVELSVLPRNGKVPAVPDAAAVPGNGQHTASPSAMAAEPSADESSLAQRLLEGQVIEAVRSIYDPEIPINIYELGLIYEIKVDPQMNVRVKMTLTAPACPVAGSLPGEVERRIEAIDAVKSANVELVWEPPWTKDRMSEAALLELGMF